MTEIRCKKCNRLLFRIRKNRGLRGGTINIKCGKCGLIQDIEEKEFEFGGKYYDC